MLIKQKIISSSFLVLLLMPILLCGYFLWQQHSIKEEMEERLENEQLTTLSILKKDIQWIEKGKELVINGEMFDVKSIEEKDEMLYIKGLYDVAEKKIKQKISTLLNQKNTSNSPLQKIICSFFDPIICLDYKTEELPITFTKNSKIYFFYREHILFCKTEVPTPPPNKI